MILQIFTLALLFRIHVLADAQVVVDTRNGKVGGHWMTSRGGRQFLAFLKIPYAIPPIENYRFKPPVEIDSWNDIKNETEPGPRCIQYNTYEIKPKVIGDENCLYLAVYTHNTTTRNAVMIHIHGGGFFGGTGPRRTEPHYMMDEDVVIVDINYRLGFLGFLSFEDKEMPGNQGLKDQVLAMKWVQKNIAKFGGDPNKVTLVGESAGAGSAYHHTVSPMSKGLFHRAIAESGTSYNPWGVAPPGHAKATAKKLAKNLGCPTKTTSEAVSCLLKKNASDIASSLETFKVWQIDTGIIWPCLEPPGPHAFLTGPVSNWQHNPVPLMLGTTSGEGLLRTGCAPHTEEMNFIWQNPYANWTHEGDDLKFSKRLVKIWTDFAKFGNPAPKGFDLSWAKWDPRRHNYLVMSNSGFEQKEGFAKDTYNFWKSFNFRDNIK
ncbi:esterase FE4 isoform X2 [Halyomorpha halys]|uniref:esterase FE4 isoform X2 n=1 Tax=Halyomorpha halys TaxID=286706 RepID=UPI0034D35CAF